MLLICAAAYSAISPAATSNLLKNSGFESDKESWNFVNDGTGLTDDAYSGELAAVINGESAGVIQIIDAIPESEYEIRVQAKVSNNADRAFVGFLFRDENGRNMAGTSFNRRVTSATFTEYAVNGNVPVGARQLVAFGWKETANGSLVVDDFKLSQSSDNEPLDDSDLPSNSLKPLFMQANFVVNSADQLLDVVDRAKKSGANTVILSDSKVNRAPFNEQGVKWEQGIQKFVDGVKARDMNIYINTVTMGYCSSLSSANTNLATGYPIVAQPLRAVSNELVPIQTATVPNGGFEEYSDDLPAQWGFQDAPGIRTFIDTTTKLNGNASLRLDGIGGLNSRIITSVSVEPYHQYTLRFWIKTRDITARRISAVVRDKNDRTRRLMTQSLSTSGVNKSRNYFESANQRTLEWTEMKLAFNSLDATQVDLLFSVFGGSNGSVWLDDVELIDTPTLNWLVRDDLPSYLTNDSGARFEANRDYISIDDPELGQAGFAGRYTTYHDAPTIESIGSGSIVEGQTVYLYGYHALVSNRGQISCSWNSPETYLRMRQIHEYVFRTYQPDGVMLNYDEIRSGGFEPSDQIYTNSGEALAASISRALSDLNDIAPGAKHLFWSDMIDPFHNAKRNYYQVANTLEGSWLGVDPSQVVLATWWAGDRLVENGENSLRFFADLGFEQIVGAFYDQDVVVNHRNWMNAAENISGVIGGIYASWTSPPDFSQIESFGELWWQ